MGWMGHSMNLVGNRFRVLGTCGCARSGFVRASGMGATLGARAPLLCTLALTLVAGFAAAAEPPAQRSAGQIDIIPMPAHVEPRNGAFVIRPDATLSHPRDAEAARTASYFADLMLETRGLRLRIAERAGQATQADAIIFRLDPALSIPSSEGYEIDISPTRIMLSARDPRGLFYAAVTLWELCTSVATPGDDEITVPAMRISDSPRFSWRALMLDSARHYQSPDFIMRLIDWMAVHKLNILQWHLSDDQGWRLQIRKYPRLTSVGAWRLPPGPAAAADIDPGTGQPRLYGGFYTQDRVRQIVAHAAERYVTIVPEIDVPGHATAAIVAYPSLSVSRSPPSAVPSDWGVYPNLLSPKPATIEFLEQVLDEVLELFPGDYVHMGGEGAGKDLLRPLQDYLQYHGRKLLGWDDILEGGVGPDAAIVSRSRASALVAAANGHDVVLSPSPTLYFDNAQGDGRSEPPGGGTVIRIEDVYRFDPIPASMPAQQRAHLLGVQANLWTEHLRTSDRVEDMTFPRAAALAEVGWSNPEHIDWESFLRRLPTQLDRYRALGIQYSTDIFAVNVQADLDRERERVHLSLSNQGSFGEIHYTLDGSDPSVAAPLYDHPLDLAARGEVRAEAFQGRHSLAGIVSRGLDIRSLERRTSHQLQPCTRKQLLSLEDDAPVNSGEPRAVFLIDILDPCWIFPDADLSHVTAVQAAVGQVPYNFRTNTDSVKLNPPHTAAGELEVRIDSCEGPPAAVLPLEPAEGNNAVTTLPPARLAQSSGRHDLCFQFTQRQLDPLWAIDWVQLVE